MTAFVFGVLSYVYFRPIKQVASVVFIELQGFQIAQQISHIPFPSAIFLFSMGLLGLICVVLAERKKKRASSKPKPLKR
jgi:hypothetical protein